MTNASNQPRVELFVGVLVGEARAFSAQQLLDVVGVDHQEEVMTAGEQLIERGRKDGLEKGMKDGLEKGMKAAGEASLLKLLRARFGAVPEAVAAKIHAANSALLGAWFDRALTATTLDTVLDADAGATDAG